MADAAPTRVIFTADQIAERVDAMAREISASLGGGHLLCLVVLRGGFFFGADLIRRLDGFERVEIDFVQLTSYAGTRSMGEIKMRGHLPQVAGWKVLVVEDLLDTGLTLKSLDDALRASGAASVHYAVLVDKVARRKHNVKPDYVAFRLDTSDFIVGYGMDYNGSHRTMSCICSVPPDAGKTAT